MTKLSDLNVQAASLRVTPEELATIIENFVNFGNRGQYSEVAEQLTEVHATLQNNVYTLFITFIQQMAEKEGYQIDPRNREPVERCQLIARALKAAGKSDRPTLI